MPRVLITMRRPYHVSPEEAEAWLREQLEQPLGDAVEEARLTTLSTTAPQRQAEFDWLLELEFADAEHATRELRAGPWADLVADMRLLGMQPAVTLASAGVELRRRERR